MAWFEANRKWLQPYAAFCFLRDIFGTAEHWKWGALSQGSPEVGAMQLTRQTLMWKHAGTCFYC
jgi:hypothetical protein